MAIEKELLDQLPARRVAMKGWAMSWEAAERASHALDQTARLAFMPSKVEHIVTEAG